MFVIRVHKASLTILDDKVEDVIIEISQQFKEVQDSSKIAVFSRTMQDDADLIVTALAKGLPQGTLDRVLSILLTRRATLIVRDQVLAIQEKEAKKVVHKDEAASYGLTVKQESNAVIYNPHTGEYRCGHCNTVSKDLAAFEDHSCRSL